MSASESPTHFRLGPVTHACALPGYDRIGEEAGRAELQVHRRLAPMIHARGLGRRFGDKRALTDVDLDVGAGELLLVTGPNGAGKTTLLRLLAGLIVPTAGELEVAVDRARIGFLGHEPLLYRELTPLENLDLYGRLYRIPERRERIGMLLERFGLWQTRREQTGAFSRGMLQRLALCRALLHEPALLLLPVKPLFRFPNELQAPLTVVGANGGRIGIACQRLFGKCMDRFRKMEKAVRRVDVR